MSSKAKEKGVQYIPIDGGFKVWTKKVGKGPIKMLLLHGGPGNNHQYLEIFQDHLPEVGIQVIFYDQLGSYNSDRPNDESLWTVPRFTEEVEQVRKGLGLEDFFLYGHSWGAILGIEYALKYPQHLKGLILSNMTASTENYSQYLQQLRKKLPADVLEKITKFEEAKDYENHEYDEILMRYLYSVHICRSDPWPEPAIHSFENINRQVYHTLQGPNEFIVLGRMKGWDRWADLPKISVPTLVIGGKWDTMDPLDLEKMAKLIPDCSLYICELGSHLTFYDDEMAYFRALIAFVKDVLRDTKPTDSEA